MAIYSTIDLPESYTELEQTLNSADLILSDAVANATTLFHTPVVSSFDGTNINSRVMVLREFSLQDRIMRFHTDQRAPKIQHYSSNSVCSVLGYDPKLKIQIKLKGKITTHHDNDVTKTAWDESTPRSKKCYSVKGGSSKAINNPSKYDIKKVSVEEGYQNFAVLVFSFDSLEFLYLKGSGHRRALHTWDEDHSASWLVP